MERLRVGEFVIDFDRQRVWNGEEEIVLRPTEQRLLFYLALHAGWVLPYDQILRGVWGDYDAEREGYGMVREAMRRLRRKVPRRLIITRRGIGYVFAPLLKVEE